MPSHIVLIWRAGRLRRNNSCGGHLALGEPQRSSLLYCLSPVESAQQEHWRGRLEATVRTRPRRGGYVDSRAACRFLRQPFLGIDLWGGTVRTNHCVETRLVEQGAAHALAAYCQWVAKAL